MKKIGLAAIVVYSMVFTSCQKCWECQTDFQKIRYSNGTDYRIVATVGGIAYDDSINSLENDRYYQDSIIMSFIITERYCGTQQQMDNSINENNVTLDKFCLPSK